VNSSDRILIEDEPVTDLSDLRDEVKKFVLNFGQMDAENQALYNTLPQTLRALSEKSATSSDNPKEAVVSFKADRGTSYEVYLEILDELQAAYYEIYAERLNITSDQFRALDQRNDAEREMYKRAREGFPMNISIAEPTKIGG
jgi:hypothetical protein